jgi:hypothetical protein
VANYAKFTPIEQQRQYKVYVRRLCERVDDDRDRVRR